MRKPVWILLAIAACGGTSTARPTTPSNTTTSTNATTPPTPTAATPAACNRPDEFGPVMLDDAEAAQRHGASARRFADAPSSQEHPIEVCGVGAELRWLKTMTCNDGSTPYPGDTNPDESRTGNTGPGGRCGSIIDLYPAHCPEATYQVYMDMYMCAKDETFM
ncbi:MAG TPA: hypothetical protein VHE35_01140 [Kofleriaceae bacterium]|nr:hypothetical protein [Kofleriaceae bacterium]